MWHDLFIYLFIYIVIQHANQSVSAIEDDYAGPKLENGQVTLAFMKEMMEWFEDQKKLHRKCAYQVNVLSYSLNSLSLLDVESVFFCFFRFWCKLKKFCQNYQV